MKNARKVAKRQRSGFNGAAPFQERNDLVIRSIEGPNWQCFNGAAPFQERNVGASIRHSQRQVFASMEPLPFRSGMRSSTTKLGTTSTRFNGAAPFQERNDSKARVCNRWT